VNHSRSVDLEVIALHCKPGVPAKQRTLGAKLAAVLAVSEAEEITPHFPPVRNEPDRRGGGGQERRADQPSDSVQRILTAQ